MGFDTFSTFFIFSLFFHLMKLLSKKSGFINFKMKSSKKKKKRMKTKQQNGGFLKKGIDWQTSSSFDLIDQNHFTLNQPISTTYPNSMQNYVGMKQYYYPCMRFSNIT